MRKFFLLLSVFALGGWPTMHLCPRCCRSTVALPVPMIVAIKVVLFGNRSDAPISKQSLKRPAARRETYNHS